jgi:hypothetical protein
MKLSINIVDKKSKNKEVKGEIHIEDYIEGFYIPLEWWSIKDYERQWKEGIARLKNNDTSCLVTTIYDPRIKPFIEWWVLYRIGNKIHIQPQGIFGDLYRERIGIKPFTPNTCYDFIPSRKILTNEGNKISEWIIPFK